MQVFALLGLGAMMIFPAAVFAQAAEIGTPAVAVQEEGEEEEAEQPTLEDLRWVARPIVVFADSPNDPRFMQQMRMLEERMAELEERRVVILTDTDPANRGPLRIELRPRDFNLVLIDTDGSVAQRRPSPISARELLNLIDRMPSRRQETESRRP